LRAQLRYLLPTIFRQIGQFLGPVLADMVLRLFGLQLPAVADLVFVHKPAPSGNLASSSRNMDWYIAMPSLPPPQPVPATPKRGLFALAHSPARIFSAATGSVDLISRNSGVSADVSSSRIASACNITSAVTSVAPIDNVAAALPNTIAPSDDVASSSVTVATTLAAVDTLVVRLGAQHLFSSLQLRSFP